MPALFVGTAETLTILKAHVSRSNHTYTHTLTHNLRTVSTCAHIHTSTLIPRSHKLGTHADDLNHRFWGSGEAIGKIDASFLHTRVMVHDTKFEPVKWV